MAAETKTILGTVATANGSGFTTREHPGQRWTISRYAKPAPAVPTLGAEISFVADERGFVTSITPTPANTARDARGRTESREGLPPPLSTRLACLAAAATFLATRPEAKAADVVKVAQLWEEWATH